MVVRTRSSYRKPIRSIPVLIQKKRRRPTKRRPVSIKRPMTISNVPPNAILQIANSLPTNSNRIKFYRGLPSNVKNSLRPLIERIHERNRNIERREREISNIAMRLPRRNENLNNQNRAHILNFIRLVNNYHTLYPLLNLNRPNVNVNTMRRIFKTYPLFYGSGYYKRWANRIRPGGGKARINTNWVGPFAHGSRYVHWVSANGTFKFYPYQTRQGRMNIRNSSGHVVRHKHAKKKFIFTIPGYRY